jgi:RimJ/RimL family protein N-acetyltransferase
MSILPPPVTHSHAREAPFYLSPFDRLMAPLIASWARSDHELFWLAPKTPPPLTAAKVVAWPGSSGAPMLMYTEGEPQPLGYLELNPMPGELGHLWIGHCVVRPDTRSRGLGRRMVSLVLDQAFAFRNANRVSLVVFPENTAAVQCYRAAGFLDEGEQIKFFQTTGRQHDMIQMSMDICRYREVRGHMPYT